MFTGIVEEIGTVRETTANRLVIACREVLDGMRPGDSLSVNGVCLTATQLAPDAVTADVMGETLRRSALADLESGSAVNLERALRADGRLGGHLVQGHVDGVAEIRAVQPQRSTAGDDARWTVMTFSLPDALAPYLVEKGSITVDGTSLTVMSVEGERFSVGLIPHTLEATVLGRRREGDRVNLEADVIAKYVERMLQAGVASVYGRASAAADAEPRSTRADGS